MKRIDNLELVREINILKRKFNKIKSMNYVRSVSGGIKKTVRLLAIAMRQNTVIILNTGRSRFTERTKRISIVQTARGRARNE